MMNKILRAAAVFCALSVITAPFLFYSLASFSQPGDSVTRTCPGQGGVPGQFVTGDTLVTCGPGNIMDSGNPPQFILSGSTASITGTSLEAGACDSGTVTIAGATTGNVAVADPVTYPGDGNVWGAYISAANTVTVKVCSIAGGTPTSSVYRVRVIP